MFFKNAQIPSFTGKVLASAITDKTILFGPEGERLMPKEIKTIKFDPYVIKTVDGKKCAVPPDCFLETPNGFVKPSELCENDYIYNILPAEGKFRKHPISPYSLAFLFICGDLRDSWVGGGPIRIRRSYMTKTENDFTDAHLEEFCQGVGATMWKVRPNLDKTRKTPRARYSFYMADGNGFRYSDVRRMFPENMTVDREDMTVPPAFFFGEVSQRWDFIRGLFISGKTYEYSSREGGFVITLPREKAVLGVKQILWSLGVQFRIRGSRKMILAPSEEVCLKLVGHCRDASISRPVSQISEVFRLGRELDFIDVGLSSFVSEDYIPIYKYKK